MAYIAEQVCISPSVGCAVCAVCVRVCGVCVCVCVCVHVLWGVSVLCVLCLYACVTAHPHPLVLLLACPAGYLPAGCSRNEVPCVKVLYSSRPCCPVSEVYRAGWVTGIVAPGVHVLGLCVEWRDQRE